MAIILSQITVGDHRIMVVDSAPNTGAGITAPVGSMLIVEGQDAVWLKTGTNDTDWKVSTVDKAALDTRLDGIDSSIAQEVSDRQNAVTTEMMRATTAEQDLLSLIGQNAGQAAQDLSTETQARIAADQGLQDQINLLSAGTQGELDATQLGAGLNGDGTYTAPTGTSFLGTSISLRDAAIKLDVGLTSEANARSADTSLLSGQIWNLSLDLASEVQRATTAEGFLQTNLNSEINRASDAEGVLQSNINAEEFARTQADNAIQSELDSVEMGAGLETDGSYNPDIGSNYLVTASSLKNADSLLDAQVKVVADGLAQESIDRASEDLTFLKLDGTRAMTDALNMGGHKVSFVHTPENASDAATKQYVDDLLAGLSWKEAVHTATIPSENISLPTPGTTLIGGHTLVGGQRVLLKDQTDATENGIYVFDVTATTLSRALDADAWAELEGAVVYVEEGTNAGGKFVATIPPTGTIGVDPITFTKFSAASALDGVGTADTVAVWTDAHTIGSSLVTTQELEYVSGVTSGIQGQLNALDGRLDVVEGPYTQVGSIAKAEKDAKDYADAAVLVETYARTNADNALDARLDIIEGADTVVGSIAKAEKDAKAYADSIVSTEQSARIAADNALSSRLGTLELDPVTKTYVDAQDATKLSLSGGTMSGNINMNNGAAYIIGDSAESSGLFLDSSTAQLWTQNSMVSASLLGGVEIYSTNSNISLTAETDIMLAALNSPTSSLTLYSRTIDILPALSGIVKLGGATLDVMSTSVSLNGTKIQNVGTPTVSTDAATKGYVDTNVSAVADDVSHLVTLSGVAVDSVNLGTFTGSTIADSRTVKQALQDLESAHESEVSRATAAESALDGRLTTVETTYTTKVYVDAQDQSVLTASKAYTDDSITALINGAPAVLDTLKELADAIADNPNFATTIATQITGLQTELDSTQTGAGLGTNGAYTANNSANYISTASSLKDADNKLDAALKVEETARIAQDALKVNKAGDTMSGNLNMGSNSIVSVASIGINTASPETILHLEEATVKFTTRMVSSQTVGAVNSVMASVTPASNSVEFLKIKVTGIDISSHDSVAYERTVRVKNVGGVVSLGTVQADYTSEDPSLSSANCTLVQNGSDIDVRVTGVNAKTITWKAVVERVR